MRVRNLRVRRARGPCRKSQFAPKVGSRRLLLRTIGVKLRYRLRGRRLRLRAGARALLQIIGVKLRFSLRGRPLRRRAAAIARLRLVRRRGLSQLRVRKHGRRSHPSNARAGHSPPMTGAMLAITRTTRTIRTRNRPNPNSAKLLSAIYRASPGIPGWLSFWPLVFSA
jgi:hypothetical protein